MKKLFNVEHKTTGKVAAGPFDDRLLAKAMRNHLGGREHKVAYGPDHKRFVGPRFFSRPQDRAK